MKFIGEFSKKYCKVKNVPTIRNWLGLGLWDILTDQISIYIILLFLTDLPMACLIAREGNSTPARCIAFILTFALFF